MPGLFSPSTLEQVRAASDIVEVVGGYVPLKRAGANFVALCPFHKEKSPSFNVNPHKQIFHCFGCHKGGDVFTFVKEFENIGFTDAVRRLAERARIPIETSLSPGQENVRHLKDLLLHVHEQVAQRWQQALKTDAAGETARLYLAKRSVTPEAIELFRIGFAPEVWDDTVNWAKAKGHELTLLEEGGLIIRKEGTDHFYDRFRGRLIFPICDEQGRVIGFSGRILQGDEKTAKYVNSPESPIFTKGKVFFGLDKSKRALLDRHSAIVCEGQLDLIACFMGGVKNVVAPQGTALTSEHARILKRYVEEVILCFDSDVAGQNAAVRSLDSLLAAGLAVRVAVVPAPHDPDSFIKEFGGAAFEKLIGQAHEFYDFYLNRLCAENDPATDRGRRVIVSEMAESLRKADNVVVLDAYAQKTASRLAVSTEAVRAEFKKSGRVSSSRARPSGEVVEVEEESKAEPPSSQEMWLLRIMLETDDDMNWVAENLDPAWVEHGLARRLVTSRIGAHRENRWHGLAPWLAELDSNEARALVTAVVADDRALIEREKILKGAPGKPGVVEHLRNRQLDRKISALNQQMGDASLTESQITDLMHQKEELRRAKQKALPG